MRSEEDTEPLETSLESLDEGQDDEEEDDFFKLDAPVEDTDEDDEDNVLDDEDEDDEWRYATWERPGGAESIHG